MPRPQSIADEDLIGRLSCVFREVGYDGASLAVLSERTGLQKASLYHRFPQGKEQMAREVLAAAAAWLQTNILAPLRGGGSPRERLAAALEKLDVFYSGGRQSCLLNLLSSPRTEKGPFAKEIKAALEALIATFAGVAKDSGFDAQTAQVRAERAVMLLQGSLVLARGLASSRPFKSTIAALPDELLAGVPDAGRRRP